MGLLTREEILESRDLERERVPVPEWGKDGEVLVQTIGGDDRDRFEATALESSEDPIERLVSARARMVSMSCIDEEGKRVFSEADVMALGKKSAKALDRVFAVAQRLSGIGQADIEEITKNSKGGQSDDSGTE